MSKELQRLEQIATMKCITDPELIDRIIGYMLSLPFSYFQKDQVRYDYLCNDLCKGFGISHDDVTGISLEDTFILIGYEPGNPYFNVPDSEGLHRKMGKRFNAAEHSYILGLLINNFSRTNIRIRQFTCIGLSAYTDYLAKKVEDEYKSNLIPFSTCSDILRKVEEFKQKTRTYMLGGPQVGSRPAEDIRLGELISKAIITCGRSWMCTSKSLERYSNEIIAGYDMLNTLFMDGLRMPLIRLDRERFHEIITQHDPEHSDNCVNIDYEPCYEHGGIIKQ